MKLYFAPGSCGLAPQIALRESEQNFELIKVDFATKTTIEGDYLTVAPKGSVPALMLNDGDVLTEVVVLLQWIADNHPQYKLLPPFGSRDRYLALEWLNFTATDLHRGMAVMFSPLIDATSKAKFAADNLASKFRYIDDYLFTNDYVLGEDFSVADAYLYNVLSWTPRVNINLESYRSIQRFMRMMEQRPSVREALKAEGIALPSR
ncbi:glutathione transferase GstA [Cedecea lapagei]|uniref:glutathione transferase GstA n=1 Tax=Cedecea lapagei TaxID=158823 RepID=UPI001BCF66B3|nr:glutathione transferase GstA [Cedecea lapagei]